MRKLSVILTLILLLALFAGCVGTPELPTVPATPEISDAPSTAVPTEPVPVESAFTEEELAAVHPMLFRVTGEAGQELYLFGTIHVGDRRIGVALNKLLPWLDSCEALAVEFDVIAFENDMAAQMQSMTQFLLTDGSKVSDYMPAETFERASALLQEAGLYPKLMESYKLSMWAQLVEQAALLTRTDYDLEIGMDRALIRHCYDRQMEVRDVESAELQYGLLNSFSDRLNLLLIENTLDSLEDYGAAIDELYAAWLEGDYDNLTAVLKGENEAEEAELSDEQLALLEDYNHQMLTQRNLGMRDKALEWLRAGDKVFFAVGAAHLVDEGGLVELLRAEGCTVEQIVY